MTRSPLTHLALIGLLLAALPAPAFAQKPTLDSRIEVRFEAAPAAEVFRQIISGLGLELQIDSAVDDPVTIWVTNVAARTALNVVCESLGCTWRTDGTRLVVSPSGAAFLKSDGKVPRLAVGQAVDREKTLKLVKLTLHEQLARPLPVDMQFKDVPVSTILRALSEVSGLEITADEPVASKHVTLTGSGRTVEDALKAVIEQAGGGMVTMVRITRLDKTAIVAIKPKTAIKIVPKK